MSIFYTFLIGTSSPYFWLEQRPNMCCVSRQCGDSTQRCNCVRVARFGSSSSRRGDQIRKTQKLLNSGLHQLSQIFHKQDLCCFFPVVRGPGRVEFLQSQRPCTKFFSGYEQALEVTSQLRLSRSGHELKPRPTSGAMTQEPMKIGGTYHMFGLCFRAMFLVTRILTTL